ncbi:MAG: ECF transporter S component [Ruminococcaceae bacterium]|nr:ECF transporter S component [Oscillospiraceae bacterium]
MKGSISFIITCVVTIAVIYAVAKLFEVYGFKKNLRHTTTTKRIAYIAMFSALGGVVMLFEIPLPFAPPFYKIDLSELPVLMCTLYLGPVAGVTAEFLKVAVKLLIKGTSTAFVGDFANFVVGISFILPASIVYHYRKTRKTAVIGLIVGTLCMTVFGSLFNAFYLIPKFSELFKLPVDAIIAMGNKVNSSITDINSLVLFAVVPFNLIKGTVVSIVTYLLYKRVEKIIFKEG